MPEAVKVNLTSIAARKPDEYRTVWIEGMAHGNCIGLTVAERNAVVAMARAAFSAIGLLRALSTYEKNPPEIVKDDFAYDRLLEFVHEECARACATWDKACNQRIIDEPEEQP